MHDRIVGADAIALALIAMVLISVAYTQSRLSIRDRRLWLGLALLGLAAATMVSR